MSFWCRASLFDRTLNRLGRGKGFYDKILSQTKACKIGICFDFQLLDRIPTEVHDVRMTQVISVGKTIINKAEQKPRFIFSCCYNI